MFNPLETMRKIKSRLGKPIRPIIEVQKGGSIVNIVTKSVQSDPNIIHDSLQGEAWQLHPDDKASAIYIDGLFKGMGYFAGEEGHILKVKKEVTLLNEVYDSEGNPVIDPVTKLTKTYTVINMAFKGINSKLLDGAIIERGSALKPSMSQTIIYCVLVGLVCFMLGMVWQ